MTFNMIRSVHSHFEEKGGGGYLKCSGVDIFAHLTINIVENNKHFGKRWKAIRKIQHF